MMGLNSILEVVYASQLVVFYAVRQLFIAMCTEGHVAFCPHRMGNFRYI